MTRQHVFVIAEAGVNHNGDPALAKKMVDAAVAAGADAVKFQTFVPEAVISRFAPKAAYQQKTTDPNQSQLDMARSFYLDEQAHRALLNYCVERKIEFLSTPFDLFSIDFLHRLGLKRLKIPSGEITNLPYLRRIGFLGKQLVLSTGMADIDEIKQALDVLTSAGTPRENITILHCHTDYPTAMEDVNLKAMLTLQKEFGVKVGYSDHTLGIEVPIAAVALGASIIEKHFTLDRTMSGPDHKASLEPDELIAMVCAIRNIEKALGDGVKKPTVAELENRKVVRKSIVAARDIAAGEIFTKNNITTKRPGEGLSPLYWDKVIGQRAKQNFCQDEYIII